jgi:hypothetical protein
MGKSPGLDILSAVLPALSSIEWFSSFMQIKSKKAAGIFS